MACEVLRGVGTVEAVDAVGAQYAALLHAHGHWHAVQFGIGPSVAAGMENADVVHGLAGQFDQAVDVGVGVAVGSAFLREIKMYVSNDVFFVRDAGVQNLRILLCNYC